MSTIAPGVQPGDFFCVYAPLEIDKLITLGEWLNGDRFARTKGRQFAHSGVVTDVSRTTNRTPAVTIVEAEPGGVRKVPWHYDSAGYVVVWSTGVMAAPNPGAVVTRANQLVGTPYGWLNYPAIGARRFHLPIPYLDTYIASNKAVICSQLTDLCERAGGLVLRPDEVPGFVTPQQIADILLAAGAVPIAAS